MVNTKTGIKSQKFNISSRNLTYFLFLLFSTVYNAKERDMLFIKSVLILKDRRIAKISRNSIVNQNALNSEGSLVHY